MTSINCNSTLCDDINGILKKGWESITKKYAKESNSKQSENELKLLTGIRIYYVDKLFQCAKKEINNTKNSDYFAFGSTNITSDYDLTIIGKKAPEIMLYIFNKFLENINKTTTFSFDTNLYCMGFYSSNGLNKNLSTYIVREKPDSTLVSFQPKTVNDKDICYKYAQLKLLEAGLLGNNEVNAIITLNEKLTKQLNDYRLNNKNINKNNNTKNLIKRYYTYYDVSKQLFKFLYKKSNNNSNNNSNNSVNVNNFMEYMCQGLYYSIEAYYTPCTVNVVVLEMQAGKDIGLDKFNYLISAIENLGDFNIHLQHSGYKLNISNKSTNSKKVILKLSKYLYRFYYSLEKIYKNNNNLKFKVNQIKNKIMSKRSSGQELNDNDLKIIDGFKNSNTLRDSIDKFNTYALNKIHSSNFF